MSLQAAGRILEYLEGRPVQRQELSGPGGSPIHAELAQMSNTALQAHVQSLLARWPKATLPTSATRLLAGPGEPVGRIVALDAAAHDSRQQRVEVLPEGRNEGGRDEQ